MMKSRETYLAALAAVFLVAASPVDSCQTGPVDPGTPQLEFVVGLLQGGQLPPLGVDSISAGQVVLRGGIGTPVPCYTIEAELGAQGSTLTLTIEARAQDVMCIQVVGAFEYRARIYGLGAGRYTLVVATTFPGTDRLPRSDTLQVDIP